MSKPEIAYKVLRRLWDGRLVSAVQFKNQGGRTYPEGRTIYPRANCGPLAIFRTLSDARSFAVVDDEIWKVKIRRSRKRKLWYLSYYKYKWALAAENWATGTIPADSVRLIERVETVL